MSLPSQEQRMGIHRRGWLALAVSTLSGCGGGGGSGLNAALPGTGGTGVYVQGSIAGFGSVIVNSLKFDDTRATVLLDGVAATSADLRLGMVAEVQGSRGADPLLATASSIAVWSIGQGRISQVQAGQFVLMGMTIQTDSGTVFDGLASGNALAVGQRVSVWGLQAGVDGLRWTATRVALSTRTDAVLSGQVSLVNGQRWVNGFALTGTGIASLTGGQLVRVQGSLSGSTLQASAWRLLNAGQGPAPSGEAEIEGLVTALLSRTRFMLGTVEVDASSGALGAVVAQLSTGSRVEVNGVWQGQVLQASRIELEDAVSIQSVEIEGNIQQYTGLSNIVVRGQQCDASGTRNLSASTIAALKVGVKIKIKGVKSGDTVLVSTLELSD